VVATEPEPDPVITTTDDFEVDDDTTTTDQLYQEYYANEPLRPRLPLGCVVGAGGGERGDARATCARETGGCFETAARNNWTFLWLLSAGTCILVGSFMSSFFIS
jgi:hypothetical protein